VPSVHVVYIHDSWNIRVVEVQRISVETALRLSIPHLAHVSRAGQSVLYSTYRNVISSPESCLGNCPKRYLGTPSFSALVVSYGRCSGKQSTD
jgi:hypothetical protein